MAATIVFPKHARWYAPLAWYQQLASALPSGVIVNAGGEVVDRDPLAISRLVLDGGIWADYGGYPMWYREDPVPYPPPESLLGEETYLVRQGTLGFSRFLTGLNLLFSHTFMSAGFKFPRSLVVEEPQVPEFVIPNTRAPHTEKTFSSFGLLHPNGGMYFYAYASPDGTGVEPGLYAIFINTLLTKEESPVPVPVATMPPWLLPLLAVLGASSLLAYGLSRR